MVAAASAADTGIFRANPADPIRFTVGVSCDTWLCIVQVIVKNESVTRKALELRGHHLLNAFLRTDPDINELSTFLLAQKEISVSSDVYIWATVVSGCEKAVCVFLDLKTGGCRGSRRGPPLFCIPAPADCTITLEGDDYCLHAIESTAPQPLSTIQAFHPSLSATNRTRTMAVRSSLESQMGHSPDRPVRAQVGLRSRGEEAESVAVMRGGGLYPTRA